MEIGWGFRPLAGTIEYVRVQVIADQVLYGVFLRDPPLERHATGASATSASALILDLNQRNQ